MGRRHWEPLMDYLWTEFRFEFRTHRRPAPDRRQGPERGLLVASQRPQPGRARRPKLGTRWSRYGPRPSALLDQRWSGWSRQARPAVVRVVSTSSTSGRAASRETRPSRAGLPRGQPKTAATQGRRRPKLGTRWSRYGPRPSALLDQLWSGWSRQARPAVVRVVSTSPTSGRAASREARPSRAGLPRSQPKTATRQGTRRPKLGPDGLDTGLVPRPYSTSGGPGGLDELDQRAGGEPRGTTEQSRPSSWPAKDRNHAGPAGQSSGPDGLDTGLVPRPYSTSRGLALATRPP